jgi:hypothetical protein
LASEARHCSASRLEWSARRAVRITTSNIAPLYARRAAGGDPSRGFASPSNEGHLRDGILRLGRHNNGRTIEEFSYHRVSMEHMRDEPLEPASLGCEQQFRCERCPNASALPFIGDHQRNFRRVGIHAREVAERHDLDTVGRVQLCEQGDAAAVIHAAHESENRIWEPRHRGKKTEISRVGTQVLIELANRKVLASA